MAQAELQRLFEQIGQGFMWVVCRVAQQVAGGVALGIEIDDLDAQPPGEPIPASLQTIVGLRTPPFWLNTTRRMARRIAQG